MAYQNISVTVTNEDLEAIRQAIRTISGKMPWLITLTPDEMRSLTKLGPKSIDFVTDAKLAIEAFPNIVPSSFDVIEFKKDVALFQILTEVKIHLDSLQEKLDNTYYAVGSESMVQSLEVYSYAQTAKERVPGLKSLVEKLAERFKRNSLKKSPPKGE
jgi:hypothetical protein